MYQAIAIKLEANQNKTHLGFVKPLFINENKTWKKIDNHIIEFPNNGRIFITGDFAEIEEYLEFEPFIIEYSPNNSENASKFVAAGKDAKLPPLELCRIFEKKDFDPHNGTRFSFVVRDKPLNLIFISNHKELFGPFDFDIDKGDDDYYTLTLKSSPIVSKENERVIYKFQIEQTLSHVFEVEGTKYVFDSRKIIDESNSKEKLWYITRIELLNWAKGIFKNDIDKISINEFLKKIENIEEIDRNDFRIQQLKKLSNSLKDWLPIRENIIYDFFETEQGKEILNKFLEDYQTSVVEKYLPPEPINLKSSSDSLILENLDTDQKEFIKQLMSNPNDIDSYKQIIDLNREIGRLEGQIKTLTVAKNDQELSLNSKKQELEELRKSFKSIKNELLDNDEIKKNLLKIKTYTDILNGIVPEISDNNLNENESSQRNLQITSYSDVTDEEYIKKIRDELANRGRVFEFNEILNFCILFQQNFITVFAGLPGVGKTSLVRELAEVMGVYPFFYAIAVARGWTSSKELLGYYNPITQRFQAANTGFFKGLYLHKEYNDHPFWVLLDEANLSPVEHYWSDFMMLSDLEDEKRELTLRETSNENQKKLKLGRGLRFMATINFDHTTEVLSLRLKDRAAIVMLNIPNFEDIEIKNHIENKSEIKISYEQSNNFFGAKKDAILMEDERVLLGKIIRTLADNDTKRGMPIIISPRKIKAITEYCSTFRKFIKSENKLTALDYAILQFILPIVEGRTEKFKDRLDALEKEITNLEQSKNRLKRIIEFGVVNNHNYRFFC